MTHIALRPEDVWLGPPGDHGVSEEASKIRQHVGEVRRDLTVGNSVASPHSETLRSLREALSEATSPDWDGYGALAVPPAAAFAALRFVSLLPSTLPPPDVGADPNGRVHFEWRPAPGRAFVVSVGPSGFVNYAGLFGRNKVHGTEELGDELAGSILANLGRALGRSG